LMLPINPALTSWPQRPVDKVIRTTVGT
jgi:hypothetical protein